MLAAYEPLAGTPGAYAFAVLFGLLWGSFANVCIYRWPPSKEFPKGRSVVAPGSHCFACQTPIKWYDNVPLLSWLWLRGACRTCKAPFSARYLIVEALTGVLFGVAWWFAIAPGHLTMSFDKQLIQFAVSAAFCFILVVITFIDIDHKLILDKVTLPSIVIFYALGLLVSHDWQRGLIGIALGYGVPWAVGEIYFILSERDGLGLGDSMLLALVGALLGWRGVVASLFIGAITGSVVGVLALLRPSEAAAPSAATPPKGKLSALLAIGAVGSTIGATVAALIGHYVIAGGSCVAAIAFLVISRRMEPDEIASPVADEPVAPDLPRTPALLAALSAVLLLSAMGGVILRALVPALIATGAGLAVLFAARHLHAKALGMASDSDVIEMPEADAPSVLRTELPFGPFLALGAVIFLFAEPWIVMQFGFVGM